MLRVSHALRKLVLAGLATLPVTFVSCSTEERAPRVPVTGVDRPATDRVPNPYDATEAEEEKEETERPFAPPAGPPPGTSLDRPPGPASSSDPRAELTRFLGPESFLDSFVAKLKESGLQGPVAVFPALSQVQSERNFGWRTSELGDRLSEEIVRRLSRPGSELRPFSLVELEALIGASNRSLAHLTEPDAALQLALRLPVSAAIYGEIELVYPERGPEAFLRVWYRARSTSNLSSLADTKKVFVPNRIGKALYEEHTRPGAWKIGLLAPPYRPSVEREIEWMASTIFPSLLERVPGGVDGVHFAVVPSITDKVERQAGDLIGFEEAFASEWRSRAADRSADAIRRALDAGPVMLLGRSYPTLASVQAEIETRRAALRASDGWQLSLGVARILADRLSSTPAAEKAEVETVAGWAVPPAPAEGGRAPRTIIVRTRLGAAIEIPKLSIDLVDPDARKLLASATAEFDPLVADAAKRTFSAK